MAEVEEGRSGPQIDEVIGRVEGLYRSVTGQEPPEGLHVPIPVEKDPGQHVQEQLERLLTLVGQTSGISASPSWSPPMTAVETDGEMLVRVDLPGVSREDVEILVNGDQVTIRGRRQERAEGRLRVAEAPHGAFARRILVPPSLRVGEPRAQLKDGVLEIRFARRSAEEMAPRTVDVQ